MYKMSNVPRIIHYIWIGGNPLPDKPSQCIATWKEHMPESDWDYMLWNEQTLPSEITEHEYYKKYYAEKKWSYLSDLIRFWAVYRYGGLYLDVDIEAVKSFEPLMSNSAFVGKSKEGQIESAVIGSIAGNKFLEEAYNFYTGDTGSSTDEIGPSVLARAVENNPSGIVILDYPVLYPFSFGEKFHKSLVTSETIAIHWWDFSWGSPTARFLIRTRLYKTVLRLRSLFS